MLLLWFTGSEIDSRFGSKAFILFYIGGGFVSGLVSLLSLFLFSSQWVLVGSGPPVYALLMVWAMLYPTLDLYFLFFIKVKAKWLVAIVLGLALLINLSYGHFIPLLADLVGIIWGFAIGRLIWHLPNPYPLNLKFPRKRSSGRNKIININVFQESDEVFMDRMLAKIAKNGEEALTRRERDRMRKISEKENRK